MFTYHMRFRPFAAAGTAVVTVVVLAACGSPTATDAGDDPREFCDAAVESLEVSTPGDAASQAESQRRLFAQLGDAAPRIAETAPDEIRDDAETFADELPKLDDIMASVGYDTTKLTPEQQAELQNEAFTDSLQAIMLYVGENCSMPNLGGSPPPGAE